MINNDVLNLIQGSLYFSKKKGRALYNIKPKEYGIFLKERERHLKLVNMKESLMRYQFLIEIENQRGLSMLILIKQIT